MHFYFGYQNFYQSLFIGLEPDHCLPFSVTNQLTPSCLVDLIDGILACEDANSNLFDIVTVAADDAEKRVYDNLVQIWKLKFFHKVLFKDFQHKD